MRSKRLVPTSLFVAALIAICIPLNAAADGGKGHRLDRLDRKVSKMQEKLNLSDTQADSVYKILKDAKNGEKCKGEKFSERKQCRLEKRAAVKKKLSEVLTPEQQAKFEELRAKREEHRKERSGRRHKKHDSRS
jgi:Spy/CpxP family protein refolding chaperone